MELFTQQQVDAQVEAAVADAEIVRGLEDIADALRRTLGHIVLSRVATERGSDHMKIVFVGQLTSRLMNELADKLRA